MTLTELIQAKANRGANNCARRRKFRPVSSDVVSSAKATTFLLVGPFLP